MVTWTGSSVHGPRSRSICAHLPNGSVVTFTEWPSSSPLYGPRWRATHHHAQPPYRSRTVGDWEFREGHESAFVAWLGRIAAVALTKGPETASELGWYE